MSMSGASPEPLLEQWIERQYRDSASAMLRSFSAVDLVKSRPGFGTQVRAAKGSIIASPVLGAYDPDPDYFFHWFRDSAVVIESLRLLYEDGSIGDEAIAHLRDFAAFNLSLNTLDGRRLVDDKSWRGKAAADFVKFLRDDEDLAQAHGEAVVGETRVNPDGTLDISKWARPQHDGPPLRALALLGWVSAHRLDDRLAADLAALITGDLDFTMRHWRTPSYDIWEEERGLHYYTLRVSAAALEQGAAWLRSRNEHEFALACATESTAIRTLLDSYWLEDAQHFRSRVLSSGGRSDKELDIAIILSAIHGSDGAQAHSVHDGRMQSTFAQLEALFDRLYAINRGRPAGQGVAMGRYEGDVYYSGGAYFFSTLGAAEFCFKAARGSPKAQGWIERGDAFLQTVRAYTGAQGELSEQFDQNSGEQTSAKHLAWSYAALISTVAARRAALAAR